MHRWRNHNRAHSDATKAGCTEVEGKGKYIVYVITMVVRLAHFMACWNLGRSMGLWSQSITLEATVSAEIYSLDLDYAHVYTLRCLMCVANLKRCTLYGCVEKCDHSVKIWHGSLTFHPHAMVAMLKKAHKRKSQTISILCWQMCEAWTDYVWRRGGFLI